MRVNPEFLRNVWMDFSLHRLIALPLIIGVIASLTLLTGNYISPDIWYGAAILFLLIVVGWGTRHAASAVVEEINANTWDGQRMSAIRPWEMTWGKLFGSTAYMWYGGLLCVIWFVAVRHRYFDLGETALYLAFALLVGVIAHAVSLLMSLLGLRKRRDVGRRRAMLDQTAGLLVALIFLSFLGTEIDLRDTVIWYGQVYPRDLFVVAALAVFSAWAVLGAHQLMRIELQMENAPWAWLGFLVFGIFFVSGFTTVWPGNLKALTDGNDGRLPLDAYWQIGDVMAPVFAVLTSLLYLYMIAFSEAKSALDVRRLVKHLRFREWAGVIHRIPRTALTALVVIAVSLWAIWTISSLEGSKADTGMAFLFAVLLFAMRDIGLIYYLNLSTASRNADIMALLYIALLYSVVPMIFQAMSAGAVLPFFWPTVTHGTALTVLPVGGEVVVVYALLFVRIRKVLAAPM